MQKVIFYLNCDWLHSAKAQWHIIVILLCMNWGLSERIDLLSSWEKKEPGGNVALVGGISYFVVVIQRCRAELLTKRSLKVGASKISALAQCPPGILAGWNAENKLLGEFIKANIWTKKFNESLWGLLNEVCGGLKGLLNMLVPKELCLSLPLFSSCASSLHNGAKPLCKFGLTNPKSAVPRGKCEWEGSVSLRWDLHPAAYCEQTTVE